MLRVLPYVVEIALLIYCLVDAIQSDEGSIRGLPKLWWLVLIVLVPIVGPIAWLVAGRPTPLTRARRPSSRGGGAGRDRSPRIIAPEDDPAFIAKLHRSDPEKERLLEQWEADRKRREQQARGQAADAANPAKAADAVNPADAADAADAVDGAGGPPSSGPGPRHPDAPMDDPNPPVRPL